MTQVSTKINIADNSGAKIGKIIRILGGNRNKFAKIGNSLIVTIKKSNPEAKVKKGEVRKSKLLRDNHPIFRKDGTQILFDKNAIIIMNDNWSFIGSRIKGPLPRELKKKLGRSITIGKKLV